VARKVDMDEAARIYRISSDAVRKRIKAGKLQAEKDNQGRWQVLIEEAGPDDSGTILDDSGKLIKALENQIEYLQQESYRKDMIIMELTKRVPELPPGRPRVSFWSRFFRQDEGE